MNDDLPVKVGHYIWGCDLEEGKGDMRAFIDLSLNFAPHEKIKRFTILWAGRQDILRPVVFQVCRQPAWVILAVCAREAFSVAAEVSQSANIFCSKMIVSLYNVIPEMDSFPMSVAINFCDMQLHKYLDLKTVLIYRPHPVYYCIRLMTMSEGG
jgi:hypothetical protein